MSKPKVTRARPRDGAPRAPRAPSIREPVMDFAALMESRLRRHDADRGERGWIGADTDWLMGRAFSELGELVHARSMMKPGMGGTFDDVRAECADAANFLMMIADQHRPMVYKRRRPARPSGRGGKK